MLKTKVVRYGLRAIAVALMFGCMMPVDVDDEPDTFDGGSSANGGGFSSPSTGEILGVWTGNWGTMVLKQVGNEVWGAYGHDEGTVRGTYANGVFKGWWCEIPSRMPTQDAGDVEFRFKSGDGGLGLDLDGRWTYGATTGTDWREDWDLSKSSMTPPADLEARLSDATKFCTKP